MEDDKIIKSACNSIKNVPAFSAYLEADPLAFAGGGGENRTHHVLTMLCIK